MKILRLLLIITSFILPIKAFATDHLPWLGNYMQLEWRQNFAFETFPHYDSTAHIKHQGDRPLFFNTSLSLRFKEFFSFEVEGVVANTRRQSGGVDHLKGTGRFLILNDIGGDPLSLVLGGSYIQAFIPSLHDPSSFHHGRSQGECFISIGKEKAVEADWLGRLWAFGGIGFAEKGFPWLRGQIAYESKFNEQLEWRLFINGLKGMGSKPLKLHDFQGYGAINHGSLDLGMRLTYQLPIYGNISFEYTRRLYTQNFPSQVDRFLLHFLYYLN